MRAIERLLDQLNRGFGGEAWHGPALRELLEDVTEDEATAHPIAGIHSILELVAHVTATMDLVSTRLAGTARELTTEEDWSDVTRTSWPAALEELDRAESRVCDAVARLATEDLDRIVVGRSYSVYVMVHGVVQHNLYHAGQIAILKNALRRTA
jgi:uncharacterized damage-inducible protein DinB